MCCGPPDCDSKVTQKGSEKSPPARQLSASFHPTQLS
eukprot:SAG22_NODE_15836_length_339_cov_0.650000_1_plen_36_part_01